MKRLALILFALCLQAQAEETTSPYAPLPPERNFSENFLDVSTTPARSSYVGFVFGGGDFAYSYSGISGGIGIGKNWRINLGATSYKNEEDASTKDAHIGADYIISDSLSVKLNLISKNEPNDIRGTGGSLGADWVISDLWHGDWQSIIFLETEGVTYQQYKGVKGNIPDGEKLKQNMLLVGTSQELWHIFMITLTVTAYGYDGKDPDLWAGEVAQRRATPDGSYGLIKGFQKSSSSLQLQWFANDWLTMELGGSTLVSTLKQTTKVTNLGANIFWRPHWSFDVMGSVSTTDGQRDGAVLGGGVKYTF